MKDSSLFPTSWKKKKREFGVDRVDLDGQKHLFSFSRPVFRDALTCKCLTASENMKVITTHTPF
jgi:hypothetical protein